MGFKKLKPILFWEGISWGEIIIGPRIGKGEGI